MRNDYNFLQKITILLQTVKNMYMIPFDRLGLKKHILYSTYSGIYFLARSKTTDLNEGAAILSGREYPENILRISKKKKPIIIDGGAHIGTFTLFVKQVNSSSHVFAVEPLGENLDLFKKNIQINKLKNIVIIPKALAKKEGARALWIGKNLFDAASFINYTHQGKKFTVKTTTITNIIKKYHIRKIDVLKLDIEGAELEVLQKDKQRIFANVRVVILEYHQNLIPQVREKIIKLLTPEFTFCFEHRRVLGFTKTK